MSCDTQNEDGLELGSVKGGSGTIFANTNSINITHGFGETPTWAVATASNDAAAAAILEITAITASIITVAYPTGVTQPDDGTFYWEVGT